MLALSLIACGGAGPTPKPPAIDTGAIAADIDDEQAQLAAIVHRDRADCPALAAELKTLFARLTTTFQRAHDAQNDPGVAKRLKRDLQRYDAVARQRDAEIDADINREAPCVNDASVRAVLMTMPTL